MRLEKEQRYEGETELQKLLQCMLKIPNAKVQMLKDDDDELLAIFLKDARMALGK